MFFRILLSSTLASVVTLFFISAVSAPKHSKIKHRFGIPFFGSLLNLIKFASRNKLPDFHKSILNGEKIVSYSLVRKTAYSVADASILHFILSNPDKFPRHPIVQVLFEGFFDRNLIAMQINPIWSLHRRLFTESFKPSSLQYAFDISKSNTLIFMSEIKKLSMTKTKNIEFDVYAKAFTGDIILEFIYSHKSMLLENVQFGKLAFDGHLTKLLEVVTKRVVPKMLWSVLGISNKDVQSSVDALKTFVKNLIEEKKNFGKDRERMDLVDSMIDRIDGVDFTENDVIDESIVAFMAAGDEISNLIIFILYELLRNPLLFFKIKEEAEKNTTQDNLQFNEINKLVYLDQFIKETLRIHSPVMFPPRIVSKDIDIDGFFFKKGSMVNISGSIVQLDVDYWGSDALDFRPERWDAGFQPIPGSYCPFGIGPQMCFGSKLVNVIIKTFVVGFLNSGLVFELSPNQDFEVVTTTIFKFKEGLKVDVVEFNN